MTKRKWDMVQYVIDAMESEKRQAADIEEAVLVLRTLYLHRNDKPPIRVPVQDRIEYSLNGGRIKASAWLEFLKALEGLKIDQFRRCKIESCRKPFYAQRKDRWGCSPRCCAALRQSKKRREDREAQRCSCGHDKKQHFVATRHVDAGCNGDHYTCTCQGFVTDAAKKQKKGEKE